MWRIFSWLDRHEPSLYKFTVMVAGLASIVFAGILLALLMPHPLYGIFFAIATIFALLRASYTYRFRKKEQESGPRQADLPVTEASEQEFDRRVRRHHGTEKLRRHILWLAANEKGTRGDRARRIVAGWEAAGKPEGEPVAAPPDETN